MKILMALTRSRRSAALMLMIALSGVVLAGCADGRAYPDSSTVNRGDFPFLGLNGADGQDAALAG